MVRLFILLFSVGFASIAFAQTPVAQFSVSDLTACAGFPINFTNLSTYGGSAVVSTNWDFGEGGQSTDNDPTYTYMNPGTYQVLLTVISSTGTDFELKLDYITVYENPSALFTTSGNGCTVPFDVTFTNLSTAGPDITYSWDFGNTQTSNLQNPLPVTYTLDGSYTVSLTVTNSSTGCTTTTTQTLVVSDFTAAMNAPATGCTGQPVNITDESTVGVNFWAWDSGDGQTSNIQNPTFIYGTAGTYTISLTSVNSISGCSDNTTQSITILPLPEPTFTAAPSGGCAPLSVTFTNTSGAGAYTWDFGNGATFNGTNPPVQTYVANGSYPVSLTMTATNGCIATTTVNNMINVAPPIADFNSDAVNGCAPLDIQFSDLSSSSNPVDDPIVSWVWDFGDGTNFNGQNPPVHTYGLGTFTVSLTVTTQNGCAVTSSVTDFIQVGMIDLVDFSLFPINECAKQDITFTDLSVISTPHDPDEVTYTWDFGDGGGSTDQNPIYNYPIDTGFFDIELTVTFRGCELSLSRSDQIYIKAPISTFSVPALYCNPVSFPVRVFVDDNAISGASTDNVDMIWSWGVGGDPDDLLNSADVFDGNQGDTAHDYMDYGTYFIKQIIYNYTTGCTDSTELAIFISRMDAGFTLSNDTVCNSLPFTITSTSTYTDPLAFFTYTMGDGGVVTGDPVDYNYTVPGTYDISLTAVNSVGCSDSSKFIGFHVLDPPIAAITASDDAGCLPMNVIYTNGSSQQGNGVPLSSFLWTFPDGTTQTTNSLATTTNFDFTSEGFFVTTLVATDNFGCSSPPATATMFITNPTVAFNMDPVVCDLENFTAVNTTTGFGNLTYSWNIDNVFATNNTDYATFFDENPSPLYTNVPHIVTLIATDGNGCVDSLSSVIRVSLPRADLSYIASGATANAQGEYTCPPVFETYTDLSPSYGTLASWNWVFGDGKSSNFQDPNNTYVFPGTYTLSLAITDEFGCTSDTSLVDYLTILGPGGDINWTMVGDVCEHVYEFSVVNQTFVDSIVWDLDDGTFVYDDSLFLHTYAVGNYDPTSTLIDSLGCEVTYPMQNLIVPNIVLTADAGPDQSFCGNSTFMAGNISVDGVGLWTLVSGSGNITTPDSPTSEITGLGIGTNSFQWTITNACDTILDTVDIIITDASTIADAGPDQFLCSPTTNLDGNVAITGVGIWTLFSGTGIITTPSDSLTEITGMGVGVNQFVWSISNICSTTSDIVSITVEITPTIPDAGPDQSACIPNANLAGNTAIVGTGIWTLFSGTGFITDPSSPTSGLTGLTLGQNIFVWTISNTCGTNSDTIIITGVDAPTASSAGEDQFTCLSDATFEGNVAVIGVGTWSLVSGSGTITTPSDSLSTVTGLGLGPNVFEWTINSLCGISSDQMTITVETPPTIADAGLDDSLCGNNINLTGNTALVGIGSWALVSGSGTIADSSSPTSAITGLGIGANVFEWTITNSCNTTSDTVIITSVVPPTIANAGLDSTFCGPIGTLAGNDNLIGIGTWTVFSGSGIITSPSDSASGITAMDIGTNSFVWTISNLCSTSSDTVTFTIEDVPTFVDAGPAQNPCSGSINLAAVPPVIGTGTWTLVSGTGTIVNPNSPNSAVTNLGIGVNVFQWTVSNSCLSINDQVTITQFVTPTIPIAGEDQRFCKNFTTLDGNVAIEGVGFWSLVSGGGIISDPSNPRSTITNLNVGPNIFQWTIANVCGSNPDPVIITVETAPSVASVGPDQTVCGTTAFLDGNSPVSGSGAWTLISGAGSINTISDSTSGVNDLGTGENVFQWTVSNTCDTSFAQMIITSTGPCPNEDSIANILYFYVPNTFTPNDDSFNSIFQPLFTKGYDPLLFTLYIFNRWGELIFESHDADIGWEGTYGTDGRMVQDGTYTWKIIFTDTATRTEHTEVGHVNILR